MRTIVIADESLRVGKLSNPAELLISLGDLPNLAIAKAVAAYSPTHTLAVKGNHDGQEPFPEGVTNLHLRTVEINGITFGGFAGAWRYKPVGHHLFEQDQVEWLLKDFPKVDVFVAHNSPKGIHERDDHTHQGFSAFLQYIETHQPKIFLHGHQHLQKHTRIGKTDLIGVYGEHAVEIN